MSFEKRNDQFKSLAAWVSSRHTQDSPPKSPPRVVKSQDLVDSVAILPASLRGEDAEEPSEEIHPGHEIKYLREDGAITGVEIKCACGEEVLLRFDYDCRGK